jgi:hypothetical protein
VAKALHDGAADAIDVAGDSGDEEGALERVCMMSSVVTVVT